MRAWVGFCWVITFLATCVAGLQLFHTFIQAESAPQQAAGAALALALAAIPYIFTRCWQGIATLEDHKRATDLLERIADRLDRQERSTAVAASVPAAAQATSIGCRHEWEWVDGPSGRVQVCRLCGVT